MNKFQTLMALTRVKKVKVTEVTHVVTDVVTDVVTEVTDIVIKRTKEEKALRRQAFIKHKNESGSDYTRVKKPRYNQKTMYSSDDE